ncbi:MAG: IS3 family transposase, partial [Acidimicrobiales bacterium]
DGKGDPGKSRGLLRQREQLPLALTFAFIEAEKANYPVVVLCRTLQVSTSGFYDWRARLEHPSRRQMTDEFLTELIKQIHDASRGTYGSPRVHAELRLGEGIHVGEKRVARLMRTAGIEGIYRRRHRKGTTRRDPRHQSQDDLVCRRFTVERPDALWVGDVTEHPTVEGKVYLATVLDAYSRRVIGWSIADHLRTELVVDALQMAIWRRNDRSDQTVMHTDHGSQYTSWAFGRRLRAAGILGSMGSIGDAFDNAMAESFFGTLQLELLDRHTWATRRELANAIFEYIEAFYNPRRRHSSIGDLSPVEFETRHTDAAVAA